eukprot:5126002-Amphidinium_carterae.1
MSPAQYSSQRPAAPQPSTHRVMKNKFSQHATAGQQCKIDFGNACVVGCNNVRPAHEVAVRGCP